MVVKATKPPRREDVKGGQRRTKLRLSNMVEMGGGVGELGREAGSWGGGSEGTRWGGGVKEPGRE